MLELTNSHFPIGRQKWKLIDENGVCDHSIGNHIQLTLSQCYPGQFTCGSGLCIPLEDRCNIKLNCADQSDEYECAGIENGNEYAREKTPISMKAEQTVIYINASILSFPRISTKDNKFYADFYLNLRWYDLRINMLNLDQNYFKNTLSKEELDALWVPNLAFTNSLGQLYSKRPMEGFLIRESDPLNEDISLAIEGTNNNYNDHLHVSTFNITNPYTLF